MTDKQIKQGFKEGEDAFNSRIIDLVKRQTLDTLEAIEDEKKVKSASEERLRILKLDLEDLKAGRIEKIQERIKKSPVAKECSMVNPGILIGSRNLRYTPEFFTNATTGTYITTSGTSFYISS